MLTNLLLILNLILKNSAEKLSLLLNFVRIVRGFSAFINSLLFNFMFGLWDYHQVTELMKSVRMPVLYPMLVHSTFITPKPSKLLIFLKLFFTQLQQQGNN